MKKTLAMLLALAMVSALCGMLFVSAEDANLALNKEVQNAAVNGDNPAYNAALTDGTAADAISYDGNWFGFWYNKDAAPEVMEEKANSVDGVASPTIDLGASYDLSKVRINTFLGNNSGIGSPTAISVEVSTDGETYTKLDEQTFELPASDGDDKVKVAWVEFDVDATAQYVRVNLTHAITWVFINEIEVYGAEAAGDDEPDSSEPADDSSEPADDSSEPADEVKTYEDTLVEGENGNYTCEVPYGYTWNVNYVDGTIAGEDVTVITNMESYASCNANWAIVVVLEKQEDGTYVAVADAAAGGGPDKIPEIELGDNKIALVVHSAGSLPENDKGTYPNWQGKVVAMSIKEGDVFTVTETDGAISSVYAVIPGESTDAPSEAPSETPSTDTSKPQTGDAGVLVFAVLGVVAICGAAVVIKARG